jgi:hypothetical protein
MSFNLKIMEMTMRSEILQTLQPDTNPPKTAFTKAIKKNLSAYWVMESGKLICKWIA